VNDNLTPCPSPHSEGQTADGDLTPCPLSTVARSARSGEGETANGDLTPCPLSTSGEGETANGERPFPLQYGMVCASLPHLQRTAEYGLQRAELVLISAEEAPQVWEYLREREIVVGLHSPGIRPEDFPFRPLLAALVDPDAERREQSLSLWETDLRRAREVGARYVVAHIQRPVALLGETLPDDFDERRSLQVGIEMAQRLAELSERYAVPVHIENSIANPAFYRLESYMAMLQAAPALYVCLDIGHLFLDARKYGFDPVEFATEIAPHVAEFHVYGNTVDVEFDFVELREQQRLKKHPPHPSQKVSEGWLDNEAILRTVLERQPDALVTFEVHYGMDVDREVTREGLEWIEKVCTEARGTSAEACSHHLWRHTAPCRSA